MAPITITALVIFAITYVLMMAFQKIRPHVTVVSAFVDNVATVLMIAPVALAFCKKLNISPVSSIICIAISSNLQGAATLVGDTNQSFLPSRQTSIFRISLCMTAM